MQITLDNHTAAFFDDTFHRGEAEQRFHLQGLGDRIFGAREATSRNGQSVLICQESRGNVGNSAEGVGPIFLIEESLRLTKSHFADVAFGVLEAQRFDRKPDPVPSPRTQLPILEAGVWRYHVDKESDWGCRVNPYGLVYLRNLSHTPAEQEKEWFFYPGLLGWGFRSPVTIGSTSAALLDRDADEFHQQLDEAATPRSCRELYGALEFYSYSDEQLCRGILGCDLATRQIAEEQMSHSIATRTLLGGALTDVCSWTWSMWIDSSLSVRLPNGATQLRPVPDLWLWRRDKVLADLGCRLAPSDADVEEAFERCKSPMELLRARTWAAQFTCASE